MIEKFKTDEDKYQGLIGTGLDLNVKQSMDLTISDRDDWKEEDEIFFQSLTKIFKHIKIGFRDIHAMNTMFVREDKELLWYQIQGAQCSGDGTGAQGNLMV